MKPYANVNIAPIATAAQSCYTWGTAKHQSPTKTTAHREYLNTRIHFPSSPVAPAGSAKPRKENSVNEYFHSSPRGSAQSPMANPTITINDHRESSQAAAAPNPEFEMFYRTYQEIVMRDCFTEWPSAHVTMTLADEPTRRVVTFFCHPDATEETKAIILKADLDAQALLQTICEEAVIAAL